MLVAYRCVWRAAAPLVAWFARRKDLRRGVLPAATAERFGLSKPPVEWQHQTHDRCFTLWIHGASVGECLSALPIIELVLAGALQQRRPARVVLSTTTPAARELLSRRLAAVLDQQDTSSRALCVFAPLDHPDWVRRFLDAWKPDAGLWVESELWPNLVLEAAARHIRIGVVNGRMSERSYQRWQLPLLRPIAAQLLQSFSLVLCQDDMNARRFKRLGASATDVVTNLKFAVQQRGSDQAQAAELRDALANTYSWVAVSTHDDEELAIAATHVELAHRLRATSASPLAALDDTTQVVTCIIPRHPERSRAIIDAIRAQYPALQIATRSRDRVPLRSTAIFIVDTMGETGLFFDAISTVFVGGTFTARGGHNPIEPLRAGCQVFVGPHMHNFVDIVEQIDAAQSTQQLDGRDATKTLAPHACVRAIQPVKDATELAHALQRHFVTRVSARMPQHQEMMQTLAVRSLESHTQKLLAWLAADSSKRASANSSSTEGETGG